MNKLCLHQSILCHDIPTMGHLHSLHTYNRTFMPWHTPKWTFASWHTTKETFALGIGIHCIPKRTFTFVAYLSGHWHSLHTQAGIHIHCIPTSGLSHSRHTYKGTFTSYGHSHHGIAPSGHLHHDIPT